MTTQKKIALIRKTIMAIPDSPQRIKAVEALDLGAPFEIQCLNVSEMPYPRMQTDKNPGKPDAQIFGSMVYVWICHDSSSRIGKGNEAHNFTSNFFAVFEL